MDRINKIVDLIKGCKILVDFGCDHGYVIKEAIKKYQIDYAYAIDNKEGPLNNAKKNLKGLNVSFHLLDSFTNFKKDFDTCVITGLGVDVITNILITAPKGKKYLLGPHNKPHILRDFLSNNNFKILNEGLAFEKGIYYEFILCTTGNELLSHKEKYIGKYLKNDPLFNKYQNYIITKLENIKKTQPPRLKNETQKIINYYKNI